MVDSMTSESPIQAVADATGTEVTEAFELLGNDTRLAILLALWEAKDPVLPKSEESEPTLSFTELRDRVGLSHGSQFNYHLDKLTDQFVRKTDTGYSLTQSARILHTVFAGTLRDHTTLESEPIDGTCDRCGAPLVIDYDDGVRYDRCTSCEGLFQDPESDNPPGTVSALSCPPAGLLNRTPQEFYRHSHIWTRHRVYSTFEGACPDCSGTVSTTFDVCADHDATEGSICEHCGSGFEALWLFVCDICKHSLKAPAFGPIATSMAVRSFFYERGLDLEATMDAGQRKDFIDSIEQIDVTSHDPLAVEVRAERDGDRLEVTLDDEATVVDVTETVRASD